MPSTAGLSAAASESPWDAIVLGAGPAGTIAARQLALQGKRVLLVDKACLPRDKVCGGCLGGAALDALQSVGLGHLPTACGGVSLSTFSLASEGLTASIPIGRRIAVSRRIFDDALLNEAARAGVIVCDQTQGLLDPRQSIETRMVSLQRCGKDLTAQARVVIVATGLAPSPAEFDTQVVPRSYIGLGGVLDEPPCRLKRGELLMACGDAGYVGVTAVENGRYDVAAAVRPSALAEYKSPAALVRCILEGAGLSPRCDLSAVHWHGTPPLTRRTSPVGSHRCLVVGDAAGYVEPFTGEGIGWAMQSAILATLLLSSSPAAWDASLPREWQQLHDAALSGRRRLCRMITQLLRLRPVRQLAVRGLQWAPAASRPIVHRLDRPMTLTAHYPTSAAYDH
jgi:menaquinone-9 beta-reductase